MSRARDARGVARGVVLARRGGTALEGALRKPFGGTRALGQVADDILDVTATTEQLGKTAGKDLDADKTTYPKLLTLDGAREEARRLYKEAIDSLAPFGDRATPLLAIAEYIVEREN